MAENRISYQFPPDFVWGVAAASAQIEGAASEDGKGESVWDRFSSTPGKVVNGDTPAVACDHYHRYEQDAALMQELGFKNYRLSVAWPRIYPEGTGAINEKGLEFYDRLIDSLLAHGVTPWVTLFHWDLPQALEHRGGWPERATVDAFGEYARTVIRRLSDRVTNWFTVNEIPCFIGLGYGQGVHAPGRKEGPRVLNQAYHHALMAHGHVVSAVRELGGTGAKVGLVHNPGTPIPMTETESDIAAAREVYLRENSHLMAPVYTGSYPDEFMNSPDAPVVRDGDMELIGQPTDFLGLNLYAGSFIRAGMDGRPENLPWSRQYPTGDLPWIKVTPQTLYWAIRWANEVFGVRSFYITENGSAFDDKVTPGGEILDLDRREYIRNYLISVHRASAEGFDVKGYFVWSLLDNFEWAEGYVKRFGIIHVDYATQKRTPKLSARWYAKVAAENRVL